jgi:hypothetical protein
MNIVATRSNDEFKVQPFGSSGNYKKDDNEACINSKPPHVAEITRLRKALKFLTSHLPGASELAEIATTQTLALDTNHSENPDSILLKEFDLPADTDNDQAALDAFKALRLSNLEVGRLYERYIGYLYEKEEWHVTFKGIIDGFSDLGRDLICVKGVEHHIVQAKCWSKRKEIHEKHVYQLHSSTLHYRMSLRNFLREAYGRSEARRRMKDINITSVICTTNELSKTAQEVVKYLGDAITHRKEELRKNYPMIKCNVGMHDQQRLYHLPFDPQYDSIIIGNMKGERYVETVAEARALGFRRVGT